ncbi:MAG: deoxyguanosinetriphosphate triphosphohydrolase [Rickettsiales bacterium]|jgi:dGTPase|nr:deoxyguanosinetriphosphate triphosphohydrolase [Rickettsiales bacterium]
MLKIYATKADQSLGRFFSESETIRSPFQRDRDRIIHCASFRRLEYKTQVFVNSEGDHFRTRLTHTLEVAQIARGIARRLGVNVDLTETIALAHDLGHPPFGHAGEDVLNNLMKDYGGFNHNEYVIKLLTSLENKYIDFKGLNLTLETIEGLLKHNGPILNPSRFISEFGREIGLNLTSYPSLEAQIASLSDDIAYNNHDIDDGFRAGILQIDDFIEAPLIYNHMKDLKARIKGISRSVLVHEALRKLYTRLIDDLVNTTKQNIREHNIKTLADIQNNKGFIAAFSPEVMKELSVTRQILHKKLYKHSSIEAMCVNAKLIIERLFQHYLANPEIFAISANLNITKTSKDEYMNLICNYIAGMTDRYAEKQIKLLLS